MFASDLEDCVEDTKTKAVISSQLYVAGSFLSVKAEEQEMKDGLRCSSRKY